MGPLGSRLRALRVVELRLLRDFFRGGAVSAACEVMGIAQDNLEPEVVGKILAFETVVERRAKLEVQRVGGQDYPVLEDAVLVLKRRRAMEAVAGPFVGRPLPGKFSGDRRGRRRGGHTSLKAMDVEMRTKWEIKVHGRIGADERDCCV